MLLVSWNSNFFPFLTTELKLQSRESFQYSFYYHFCYLFHNSKHQYKHFLNFTHYSNHEINILPIKKKILFFSRKKYLRYIHKISSLKSGYLFRINTTTSHHEMRKTRWSLFSKMLLLVPRLPRRPKGSAVYNSVSSWYTQRRRV